MYYENWEHVNILQKQNQAHKGFEARGWVGAFNAGCGPVIKEHQAQSDFANPTLDLQP